MPRGCVSCGASFLFGGLEMVFLGEVLLRVRFSAPLRICLPELHNLIGCAFQVQAQPSQGESGHIFSLFQAVESFIVYDAVFQQPIL